MSNVLAQAVARRTASAGRRTASAGRRTASEGRRTASAGVASAALLAMLISALIGAAPASSTPLGLARPQQNGGPALSAARGRAGGLFGLLITITAPQNGATYTQGQPVAAAYACRALPKLVLTECAGPVANGAEIDTSTPGAHTFTVTAQYGGGLHGGGLHESRSVNYTVIAAAGAAPTTGSPSMQPSGAAPGAPILGNISETAKTWREGRALARISAGATRSRTRTLPVGTSFSFSVNKPASVAFAFTRRAVGRKVGSRCVAQSRKNRKRRRCARAVIAGTLTFTAHAGTNRVRFEGAISKRRRLAPGSYTLRVTATASGKRSQTRTARFTIA
jgi:hypothetical protein